MKLSPQKVELIALIAIVLVCEGRHPPNQTRDISRGVINPVRNDRSNECSCISNTFESICMCM